MLAFLLRHVVVVVAHKVPLTFYSCYDLKVSISILPLYALRFVIVVTLLEFQMYLFILRKGKMGIEGQSGVNLYITECRVHLFSRKNMHVIQIDWNIK